MFVDVVLGLQWGDEGKGKIVDALTPQYQWVARFQGGPNAGHTIYVDDHKYVLHTIPSGIIQPACMNVIGSGVIIDPIVLRREIQMLEAAGIPVRDRLVISANAHLILPVHRLLDRVREEAKGAQRIGSTLKGISPAYQDLYAREGLRVSDIFLSTFNKHYAANKLLHQKELLHNEIDGELEDEQLFHDAVDFLRAYQVEDTSFLLNQALHKGEKVLAEGAQGALLDVGYGTYPYVTSSHTISGAACTGLGIAPTKIRKVYGIFKAYTTRVGNGPFATELSGELGETLRRRGQEFGATTGRPRRCGWLDLPALRYAVMLNGVTDLVLTKSDVLSKLPEIGVCYSYGSHATAPFGPLPEPRHCQFKHFESWEEDLQQINRAEELPEAFKAFVHYIESEVQAPVTIISTGPGRRHMLERSAAAVGL